MENVVTGGFGIRGCACVLFREHALEKLSRSAAQSSHKRRISIEHPSGRARQRLEWIDFELQ
jgi:hypothetical protein